MDFMVRGGSNPLGRTGKASNCGTFDVCRKMITMPTSDLTAAERQRLDANISAVARAEILQADGARSLGENLEQAHALILAAISPTSRSRIPNPDSSYGKRSCGPALVVDHRG